MVKKTGSKKCGIPQGVQRHRIRAKDASDGSSFATNSWGKNAISSAARLCHNSVTKVCTLLCLVPLQVSEDGKKFDFAPLWKRIVHFILVLFYLSLTAYKFAVTIILWVEVGLNTGTMICGCCFLLLLLSICTALGSSWKTLEMRDLLNSWEPVLRSIEQIAGDRIDIFRNTLLGLEITAGICGVLLAGVDVAAFSLVFDDLPVCIFPTLKRLGMISAETPLPAVLWRIGFFPMELLISLPPVFVIAFNLHVEIVGQMILQFYAFYLRSVRKPLTLLVHWI